MPRAEAFAAEPAVVLPVKRLGEAKHRLSGLLSPEDRRALMTAMLGDVLDALAGLTEAHRLVVVTCDRDAAQAARAHGGDVVDDAHVSGHSAAAALGIATARARGARRVVLVAADCPLLDPAELDGLLRMPAAADGRVLVVPDRDGTGTNALVLEPADALAPAFGHGSHARHLALARAAGVAAATLRCASLALDVDTPDDLAALAGILAERSHAAPRTAAALGALAPAGAALR